MGTQVRRRFSAAAAMCVWIACGGAQAQTARVDVPDDRALVLIESSDTDTDSTERVLTELSQLAQASHEDGGSRAIEAHAMVTVPTDSLTPQVKSQLLRRNIGLQADADPSRTHVVFKGLSLAPLMQHIDKITVRESALTLQNLALPSIRQDLVQMTVTPRRGGIAILLPPGMRPGQGSQQGGLTGTPECMAAAEKLPYVQDLATLLKNPSRTQSTINAVAFRNACLSPIVGEGAPGPLPEFVRTAAPLRIMGVLEYASSGARQDEVFCSAFLVDAHRIVTARHCFYDAASAGKANARHAGIGGGNVHFRRLSPPYERVRLKAEIAPPASIDPLAGGDPRRPIRAQADIMVLALEVPLPDVPAIKWEQSLDWRHHAWTAGPIDLYALDVSAGGEIPETIRAVRWPSGIECSVLPQGQGCHAHVCQTVGAFSGAPILVKGKAEGEIVIGGMHLGPYATDGRNCPAFKQKTSTGITDVGRDVNLAVTADLLLAHVNSTATTLLPQGNDDHERTMAGILPGTGY